MWNLSSPSGIKPMPPALECRVLTIGMPGKCLQELFCLTFTITPSVNIYVYILLFIIITLLQLMKLRPDQLHSHRAMK